MLHQNFTADRVAAFACEPGRHQRIYWDGKTPGLGVRVTAGSYKAYIFEARLHGRTVRMTIGDCRTWTVAKAQAEATRLKQLTDSGTDPRQLLADEHARADASRRDALRQQLTVGEAWRAYMVHPAHDWGARHRIDHERMAQAGGLPKQRGKGVTIPGPLHSLLQQRMTDVSETALSAWVRGEGAKRANKARQAFEAFRTFWRWCAARPEYAGVIDPLAVERKDLRKQVPRRKAKRFDVLDRSQLAAWFAAVRGLSNPEASAYLQALLLTGARREEMAQLRWTDVDFEWGGLWVRDKVAEEGRKIPLTPYLASLLRALPRRNEWVFSSTTAAGGRINEPRIPHNRALSVAGLPHVTLHGLRRTFASLAEWVEMPRGVVAQIMGHAPNATAERHYISRPLGLLAVWHGKYEAWILAESGVRYRAPGNRTKGTTRARGRKPTASTRTAIPHLRLVSIG
jgi:integrase